MGDYGSIILVFISCAIILALILTTAPLIISILGIPGNYFSTNEFCVTNGFKEVAGGAIFETLRCVSYGAYEPDVPISCNKDSVTGQRFCELRPDLIERCYECWKTKCDKNGCETIKAVA